MERMSESEMMKRVYRSVVEAVGVRGRVPVKCENRALVYVRERCEGRMKGLESTRTRGQCKDNESRLFYHSHPLGEFD